MKYLIFCVCLISICSARDFLYQLFDPETKSLEYYCANFRGVEPENHISSEFLVESSDVTNLKIGGCDNETVAYAIEACPNVRSLDLSYSGYEALGSVHLKAKQLDKLDASHNRLLNIPWFYFKQIPKVTEIDFSFNRLERLNSFDFEGAHELKRIDLSHNMINLISYSVFQNITNLEYVDLRNNLIGYGIEAFRSNKNLKVLHLEHNPLWSLTCEFFLGISPLSVFISFKYIQLVNLSCTGNPVKVISNSKIEGISTTSMGHYEIHCNGGSFANVHTFNVERIEIENVTKLMESFSLALRFLSVSDNSIGELNVTGIHRLTNLLELSLRHTHLSHFDLSMIESHKQLRSIDFSYNNLKRLNHISLLDTFDHLTQFAAVENQFEHVDEIIHRLPTSIEALDLSGNFVGNLNSASFDKLKKILVLNLSNTNLTIVDSNPFDELENLSILDVSDNDLSEINFSILSTTLSHVTMFYATDCQIGNISKVIQHLGPSLTRLHLSGNSAEDLNADTFEAFSELQYLHLDNANIPYIDPGAFRHQSKLIELNVSNNKLRDIDLGMVSRKLTALHLEGNDLMDVSNLTRDRFPLLSSLNISRNRLKCKTLVEIVRDWAGTLIGDSWNQKNEENCR